MSCLTISSPLLHRPFDIARGRVPYADRIKPMNFVLSSVVASLGHPEGVDPRRFHLISNFTRDPRRWLLQQWTDIHSGQRYGITTNRDAGGRLVPVKSYGDVLAEYRTHSEPKSADAHGQVCSRETRGLLQRRAVQMGSLVYIGKDSNRVEDVDRGLVHEWSEVQEIYADPQRDPWLTYIIPILKAVPSAVLARESGLTTRAIKSLRNKHSRPRRKHRATLERIAVEHARRLVADPTITPEVARDAHRLLRSPLADAVSDEEQQRRSLVRKKMKRSV